MMEDLYTTEQEKRIKYKIKKQGVGEEKGIVSEKVKTSRSHRQQTAPATRKRR